MKLFRALQKVALTLGLACSQVANAAIVPSTAITYVSNELSDGVFEHRYTIDTTGLDANFDQLTLFFSVNLYASVSILQVPPAWDAIVVERDETLGSDAFFDALFVQTYDKSTPLIDTFTLQVTLFPGMTDSEQRFNLLQSDTTTVVEAGFTARVTPVSEPASWALVLVASLAAASMRRGGKHTRRTQGEAA